MAQEIDPDSRIDDREGSGFYSEDAAMSAMLREVITLAPLTKLNC